MKGLKVLDEDEIKELVEDWQKARRPHNKEDKEPVENFIEYITEWKGVHFLKENLSVL